MGRQQNDVSLISERRTMFSSLGSFPLHHSPSWPTCLLFLRGLHRLVGWLQHLEGLYRLVLHLFLDSMFLLLVHLLDSRLLLLLVKVHLQECLRRLWDSINTVDKIEKV